MQRYEMRQDGCNDSSQRMRYRMVWVGWLVLLGLAAAGLRYYRVDNSLADWMPDLKSSGVIRSYLVIGGQRSSWDADLAGKELAKLQSVAGCLSPGAFAAPGPLSAIDPHELVISQDGSYTGVICFPQNNVEDEQFLQDVRTTLGAMPGIDISELAFGGPAVFHLELNRWSQQRLPVVMGMIVITGFVMLWRITGSIKVASASVLAVMLSQVILLGVISWLGRPVDMAVSMVPPMMMALGFSYAAHRALRPGVTWVLLLCLATTVAGIGSFAMVDVPPIRGFSVYGMVGLGLVWFAVVTLVPPVNDCQACGASAASSDGWTQVRMWTNSLIDRLGLWIVVCCIAVTIAAAVSAPYLQFEDSPLHYFPHDSRIVADYAVLEEHLTGMLPFHVSVSGPIDPTPLLERSENVRRVIDTRLIDPQSSAATYWCLADTDSPGKLSRQAEGWQVWAKCRGATLDWGGVARQLFEIENVVCRTAIVALPLMLLLVMIVTWFVSRSYLATAVSVWVNLFPVAVLMVVAAITGWPIGLPSLMIGAIAVGVAVDDTLHLVSSLKQYTAGDRICNVLSECWRPCVGSSLVAAAGLAMFLICPFGPTAQFGVLLSIAILAALAGDMLLLPTIFQLFETRRRQYGQLIKKLRRL